MYLICYIGHYYRVICIGRGRKSNRVLLLGVICATDMKRAKQLPLHRAILYKQQRAVRVFPPSNMAYKHKLQHSAFLCFPIYLSLTLAYFSHPLSLSHHVCWCCL